MIKDYESPKIKEEIIILEDIIAISNLGQATEDNSDSASIFDLFPKD